MKKVLSTSSAPRLLLNTSARVVCRARFRALAMKPAFSIDDTAPGTVLQSSMITEASSRCVQWAGELLTHFLASKVPRSMCVPVCFPSRANEEITSAYGREKPLTKKGLLVPGGRIASCSWG